MEFSVVCFVSDKKVNSSSWCIGNGVGFLLLFDEVVLLVFDVCGCLSGVLGGVVGNVWYWQFDW